MAGGSCALCVKAVQGIAAGCIRAKEFAWAHKALDAVAQVQDPALRKELEPLQAKVKELDAADRARVAKEEKTIELTLQRGRLTNIRAQLAQAKKVGRPADEISAIEKEIKNLERQVSE